MPVWSFGASARSPSRRRLRRCRRAAGLGLPRIYRFGGVGCSWRGRCGEDIDGRWELLSSVPFFVAARSAPFLLRGDWRSCGVVPAVSVRGWCRLYRSWCRQRRLPSSSWKEVAWRWRRWAERALAGFVHRLRCRHVVADGLCGRLQARKRSPARVRWWSGFFFPGVVGGAAVFLLFVAFLRSRLYALVFVLCTVYSVFRII